MFIASLLERRVVPPLPPVGLDSRFRKASAHWARNLPPARSLSFSFPSSPNPFPIYFIFNGENHREAATGGADRGGGGFKTEIQNAPKKSATNKATSNTATDGRWFLG